MLDLTNTAGLSVGAQCSKATKRKDGHGGVSSLLLMVDFRGGPVWHLMSYFPAAKRRGNNNYFAASKDDCGCCSCRSAAKSSVICRTSSRQLQIRYDQQRDKLFPPTSTLNILSLLVADIMVLTLAALGALFKQFLFTGFGWSYLGCQ